MKSEFWSNKTVLVTGHTGFKGSWLCIYLLELGANVIGYSLEPKHEKDNYVLCNLKNKITDIKGDIRDIDKLEGVFKKYSPDVVFHLAAQPLVIDSYLKPFDTYSTNVMGTLNVLQCIKNINKKAVGIMITTDKCYENKEQIWGYRENDTLGGYDMYSSSKACCELLINSFRNSFFNEDDYYMHEKEISSVRAGNVIGGGDWSENRIVPDCIKAYEDHIQVIIRNPKSIRPWQHVIEPLDGYILLAEKMYENPLDYSGAYNFGPEINEIITVDKITNKISNLLSKENLLSINSKQSFHEGGRLFLDISKAKFQLGWTPVLSLDEMLDFTISWYLNYKSQDVYNICKNQIEEYVRRKSFKYKKERINK